MANVERYADNENRHDQNDECRMTRLRQATAWQANDELSTNGKCRKIRGSRFVISRFRSSKSSQRSGAMLSLRATVLALRISALEQREQPCAESAYSHALLSCTCQCTLETPF